LRIALALALIVAAAAWLTSDTFTLKSLAGIVAAVWVIAGTLQFVWRRLTQASAARRFTAEMLGMVLAHLGLGVFVLGVLMVESTGHREGPRDEAGRFQRDPRLHLPLRWRGAAAGPELPC
jgi:cytochrome c-type biogenesis protein CcmF